MQSGEELEICALIIRVFSEFIAHQYSDRDIQGFLRYLQPRSLSKRFKEDSFVWVAATQEKIAFSMIDSEIENNNIRFVAMKPEISNSVDTLSAQL
jgi:hypothetical protein